MLYKDMDFDKRDVIYARVSSSEQKAKGDLDRQVTFLLENVDDLYKPIVLKEALLFTAVFGFPILKLKKARELSAYFYAVPMLYRTTFTQL